jgi:hypothetical protein
MENPSASGNPEDQVPQVNPEDIKTAWNIYADVQARHPGQQVAIGRGVLEQAFTVGTDVQAVCYRTGFLALMVKDSDGLLNQWMEGDRPTDAVFKVAAEIPMERVVTGVVRQGPPFDVEEFLRRLGNGRDNK